MKTSHAWTNLVAQSRKICIFSLDVGPILPNTTHAMHSLFTSLPGSLSSYNHWVQPPQGFFTASIFLFLLDLIWDAAYM